MDMNKITLLIILAGLIIFALPMAYLAIPDIRQPLNDTFSGVLPWIQTNVGLASEMFMTLPYWQWIGVGIVVVVTIIFDRKMHRIWDIINWGKRGDPRNWSRSSGPSQDEILRIQRQQEQTQKEEITELAE